MLKRTEDSVGVAREIPEFIFEIDRVEKGDARNPKDQNWTGPGTAVLREFRRSGESVLYRRPFESS